MKDTKYFTSERNVQILISLLKEFNINKVIASPGQQLLLLLGVYSMTPISRYTHALMSVLQLIWRVDCLLKQVSLLY